MKRFLAVLSIVFLLPLSVFCLDENQEEEPSVALLPEEVMKVISEEEKAEPAVVDEPAAETAEAEETQEKEKGRFGISLNTSYSFDFDGSSMSQISSVPSFYYNFNDYKVGDSQFGVGLDASIGLRTGIDGKASFLISLKSFSLYINEDVRFELGTLTPLTDVYNNSEAALTGVDYRMGISMGARITDEKTFDASTMLGVDVYWLQGTGTNTSVTYTRGNHAMIWIPGITAAASYRGSGNAFIIGKGFEASAEGSGSVVLVSFEDIRPAYSFTVGASKTHQGKSVELGYGLEASTSRDPRFLSSSFKSYGGLDGMPGYSSIYYIRDYAMAGLGLKIKGLSLGVKAAMRSSQDAFHLTRDEVLLNENYIPFAELVSEGIFDLGASLSYAVASSFGELEIGVGFNINGLLSFYFELK